MGRFDGWKGLSQREGVLLGVDVICVGSVSNTALESDVFHERTSPSVDSSPRSFKSSVSLPVLVDFDDVLRSIRKCVYFFRSVPSGLNSFSRAAASWGAVTDLAGVGRCGEGGTVSAS